MPFTPFHMGPGLAVKAVAGRHFSLMLFGFSQVAIDIEPLVHIIRGDDVLHGFTHTYVGATLVAVVALFPGRPLCQFLLTYWAPSPDSRFLQWLRGPKVISWPAAIAGAFVGTYSHVFLDSIRRTPETAVLLLREVSLSVLVAQKLDDLPDFFRGELI